MASIQVLALDGEIDLSRKCWIEKELGRIRLLDPQSVTILDMTEVRYADTTLLNALLQVRKNQAMYTGGGVLIVAPKIARIFEIAGLDQVFPMFDNISSARTYAFSDHVFESASFAVA